MSTLSHQTPSSRGGVAIKGKDNSSASPQEKGESKVSKDPSYDAPSSEYFSYLAIDREDRPRYPSELKADDHYFKTKCEFPDDILAIARNGFVDFFRSIRWVFFKIKELKLNQRAMKNNLEKAEKNDNNNKDKEKATNLWNEEENKYMADFLKKIIEDLQQFKSKHDGKLSGMEEKMKNIKYSIHKVFGNEPQNFKI